MIGEERYGNMIPFYVEFGRVGKTNANDRIPVDQESLNANIVDYLNQEYTKITFYDSVDLYRERIDGTLAYNTIQLQDVLRSAIFLSYNGDTGRLEVDLNEADYNLLDPYRDRLAIRIRAIGKIEPNKAKIKQFNIKRLICIDIICLSEEQVDPASAIFVTRKSTWFFPKQGKPKTIYVDESNGSTWRWSTEQSSYVELGFLYSQLQAINGTFN